MENKFWLLHILFLETISLWLINRLSVKRHSTIKNSTSPSFTHGKFWSSFRLSFWFSHFCRVLFPLLLPCTHKSKGWCKGEVWWFPLWVHVQGGLNSPIFHHSPATGYQPSWYGGTATHIIAFLTAYMSQADGIVLNGRHSRILLPQWVRGREERALTLLFLQWAGSPSCQGHFCCCLEDDPAWGRGAEIYRRTHLWVGIGLHQSLEALDQPPVLPAPITRWPTHFPGSFPATHSVEWGVTPVVLQHEKTATEKHLQLLKFLYHFSFSSFFLFVCVELKRTGLLFSGLF